MVTSGVIQGCALSGFLFAMAMDPFFNAFNDRIVKPGFGLVRACADDVAMVLRSIAVLNLVFKTFYEAEELANLALKPKKCFLVPLARSVPRSFDLADAILHRDPSADSHVPLVQQQLVKAIMEIGIVGPQSSSKAPFFSHAAEQSDISMWCQLWVARLIPQRKEFRVADAAV